MILHAQLEIWKAAYADESMQWMPETASSNASSGDMSDGKSVITSPHLFLIKSVFSKLILAFKLLSVWQNAKSSSKGKFGSTC